MREKFLPFSVPSISEEEIASVAKVLRSGWITTGPNAAAFEEEFATYCGASGAVALSSATAGMHCVLSALGIGVGDEVITPSMTWVSTPNLICLLGATPIFAEVDRDTLMVSRETIEPLITKRTKAIIPVHYAGASLDLDPLRALAQEHGIPLIEDAAHALGSEYKGARIGKTGTAIFSFHPIKNITTAEGGMVCSDNPDLLAKVKSLKFHGLGVDAFDRQTQGRAPQAQVLSPGYKYNMTDLSAVLGRGQLAQLQTFNARRTQLALQYREKLKPLNGIEPLHLPTHDHLHAWHLFIVRVEKRDAFMALLKEKQIGTGLHFRAVHLQKYYAETFKLRPGFLPHTEWNSNHICSLPLFPAMSDSDQDQVVDAIRETLQELSE